MIGDPRPEEAGARRPPIAPLFRWAGSKRKLLPVLESYWSDRYLRYVEPFAGCAALYFRVRPRNAVLGDLNQELIEAYEVLRNRPDDLHEVLSELPRNPSFYYKLRAKDPAGIEPFQRAVRFVYLNRHCFNGLFRTNKSGQFNVPYAGTKPGAIPPVEQFRRCALQLESASLRCADFGAVLSGVRAGDFVYLDPPYAVETRRVFRSYGPREFSSKDLSRLSRHLESIDARGAAFVVSYADCAAARNIFSGWNVRRVRVRRHIAGFVHQRRVAYELIVTNASRQEDSNK